MLGVFHKGMWCCHLQFVEITMYTQCICTCTFVRIPTRSSYSRIFRGFEKFSFFIHKYFSEDTKQGWLHYLPLWNMWTTLLGKEIVTVDSMTQHLDHLLVWVSVCSRRSHNPILDVTYPWPLQGGTLLFPAPADRAGKSENLPTLIYFYRPWFF